MLADHPLLMLPAAVKVREQVVLAERPRIHGLQRQVRLDRGRLRLALPALQILAPQLARQRLLGCLEPRRYLLRRCRRDREIGEAVHETPVQRVDQEPVASGTLTKTVPQVRRVDLRLEPRERS